MGESEKDEVRARLETYVIEGDRGTGVLQLNGAAARLGMPGDHVIVIGYAEYEEAELEDFEPRIVFVDAANSLILPRYAEWSGRITAASCAVGALSRFGVIRLLDPFELGAASEDARRSAGITYGAKTWTAICSMARGLQDTRKEFEQAPPLPADLPVTSLSASSARQLMPPFVEPFLDVNAARAELEEAHRAIAKRQHGTWKKVPDSSHLIADSQPDAVADAVFDLLDTIRKSP